MAEKAEEEVRDQVWEGRAAAACLLGALPRGGRTQDPPSPPALKRL